MTSYEQVNDWFFALIEKDMEFFHYFELSDDEAIKLAQNRASKYREEAVRLIRTKCLPQIDWTQRAKDDDGNEVGFDFDFNGHEELLLPMLMYRFYLFRDISKLKTYNVNFSSSAIKVFDPSNARTTFKNLYDQVVIETDQLIDDYKNYDRTTGQYRTFDPAKYDTQRGDF